MGVSSWKGRFPTVTQRLSGICCSRWIFGKSLLHVFAVFSWILANRILSILPILALLFLCSFIDRTNVGNAKILGLEKDVHLTDHQYSIGLCAFYATYIASELPSNLVLKKVSPKIWLPLLTAVWGILTMCLGFVENFASFVTVRALLGVAEGGLLPGMVSRANILQLQLLMVN